MLFRRTVAVFLALMFVTFSLAMFMVMALSNTFLKASFYQGPVKDDIYNFMVQIAANRIRENNDIIAEHFMEEDLRNEITSVFTPVLFSVMTDDLANQIEQLKENPRKTMTLSLKVFRESLLTVANNLAFRIFQQLPKCQGGETPQQDVHGLPTCVPPEVEYNLVSSQLRGSFEKAIYSAVPEQIQYDLTSAETSGNGVLMGIFEWISTVRYVLYGIMLVLLVAIALLVYGTFSDILKYEGLTFAASGILGYFFSYGLEALPKVMFAQVSLPADLQSRLQDFFISVFGLVSLEVQKIALVFLAFGGILILLQAFLRRR